MNPLDGLIDAGLAGGLIFYLFKPFRHPLPLWWMIIVDLVAIFMIIMLGCHALDEFQGYW